VNRSNLPKPILTRGPVGALRYAWLRAPPSAVPKTDQDLSEALTHKSPYEGGQSGRTRTRSAACPPFAVKTFDSKNGGHGADAPLPTLRTAVIGDSDAAKMADYAALIRPTGLHPSRGLADLQEGLCAENCLVARVAHNTSRGARLAITRPCLPVLAIAGAISASG
jgi:hypothetical protein